MSLQILASLQALELEKQNMINYLNMKVNKHDWHAVADAAMDLREIEVRIEFARKEKEEFDSVKQIIERAKDDNFKIGQRNDIGGIGV